MLLGNAPQTPVSMDLQIDRPLTIGEFFAEFATQAQPRIDVWTSNFDRLRGSVYGNAYISHACLDNLSKKKLRAMLRRSKPDDRA